ncbi:CBS domain-containing protein [Alloalcanivorax profundimaris]|uniref:CBS domain-containing protein n=1 Tax=Alloalcanivorax profundimaris TaxID=2735259 RepID=UPI00188782CC|nr:CBS domain-containing protein [Alloalcanivorax profundimaris]MBF1803077.1 CBS domain-containing protein [Alloalcanivorax profundimaris]MCQ6260559.1 CBS domain-containing protein [Alcanivorax sp. MM125-6]|tara:strand:- start:140 stop:541 length:402 start_codon:yes stop_codon:yes gene_type:complete
MASLLVKDLMVRHPLAIQQGTELTSVVATLLQSRYSGLPVVDADRQVIGFVSEQDCLRRLLVASYHQEGSVRVEDLMHDEPLTVHENQSVVDIAEMMVKQKPKIYPVLDEGGRLSGLLTRRIVLRALNDSRRA